MVARERVVGAVMDELAMLLLTLPVFFPIVQAWSALQNWLAGHAGSAKPVRSPPLAKPAIAAVALFSFLYTFNDFFLPLLYTRENPSSWVLQIGLSEFRSLHQVQWNLTMAATLLVMAPVIIVFFLAQKAFVEGVTLTGVKG